MRVLSAHKKAITCLAFARDGERLAEAAHGGKVRVWNLTTGTVEHTLDASFGLFSNQVKLAFTTDGEYLAAANNCVRLLDLNTGKYAELPDTQAAFNGLHVSPDGAELMGDGDKWFRWNRADGAALPAFKLPAARGAGMLTFPGAAYSACGAFVAVSRRAWVGRRNVNTVFVLNRASEEVVAAFDSAGNDQKRLAFSPNGQWLAAACGPVLRVYDLAAKAEVAALKAGKLHFMAAAFSPNWKWLAAVSKDRTTRFWETGAWGDPRTFEWDAGKLLDLAFAPDGATAAVASDTGKIVIFDVD